MKRVIKISKDVYIKEAFFDIVNGVKCLVKHTETNNAHGAYEIKDVKEIEIFTDLGYSIEGILK